MDILDVFKFITEVDWMQLLANPVSWIPAFICAAFLVLVVLALSDEVTSLISNFFTWIRVKFILAIPVKPFKVWLLKQQLVTANLNKDIWIKQISEINKTIDNNS